MFSTLAIRRYRPADAGRVRDLDAAAMEATNAFADSVPDVDPRYIPAEYVGVGGDFLVGELENRIVAMGAFRPVTGYLGTRRRTRRRHGRNQAVTDRARPPARGPRRGALCHARSTGAQTGLRRRRARYEPGAARRTRLLCGAGLRGGGSGTRRDRERLVRGGSLSEVTRRESVGR